MDLELQRYKADFFKALAHPVRIRIIELLSEKDYSVNELQALLGSEGSTVSQQLTVLRAKQIVSGTKDGSKVIYSLRDPAIAEVLQAARTVISNQFADTIALLDKMSSSQVVK